MFLFILTLLIRATGAESIFDYQRDAILAGELWRIVTCHFTHLTAEHLIWDSAVFLAVAGVLEFRDKRAFIRVLICSAVIIGLSLPIVEPGLDIYRGLSGVDTALFTFLILQLAGESILSGSKLRAPILIAILAGTCLKILYECETGSTIFIHASEAPPVAWAHAIGMLTGAMVRCFSGAGLRRLSEPASSGLLRRFHNTPRPTR